MPQSNTRILLIILSMLAMVITGCGGTPTPAFDGEPAQAGLPGEPIDPQFEGAVFPDSGNQDPGSGIPGGG